LDGSQASKIRRVIGAETEQALRKLLTSPNLCSRRWVWEQYDHIIGGNTVQRPGGDAAVVRVEDGPKGLALTTDVTPRYCEADPFEGGKQAVAECWRNLTAVGSKPLAITDNLNFGNPERPDIMGQFVGCVRGIAEACKALDFPVVSGNVSLYNETKFPGEESGRAILPTPSIGGVGLLEDFTKSATLAFKGEGEAILMIGETTGWLGQSMYLREICGREEGAPPPVDLTEEKENGDLVRGLILEGLVSAAHDLSDGGLLVAVAEMAMASGIGAVLSAAPTDIPAHAHWFGEDQARYLVTVPKDKADSVIARARDASVLVTRIGTTGGAALAIDGEQPVGRAEPPAVVQLVPVELVADALEPGRLELALNRVRVRRQHIDVGERTQTPGRVARRGLEPLEHQQRARAGVSNPSDESRRRQRRDAREHDVGCELGRLGQSTLAVQRCSQELEPVHAKVVDGRGPVDKASDALPRVTHEDARRFCPRYCECHLSTPPASRGRAHAGARAGTRPCRSLAR
jgi:selenophosphate synthetase-related protein